MIKDTLLAEYDHGMGTTRKLLERLPDDRLTWKPHDKSISLGVLAKHLAHIPHWAGMILNEPFFDLTGAPTKVEQKLSRAEILSLFDQSAKLTRAWLDRTDAEYTSMCALKRNG